MREIITVANKEFHDGLRNRWLLSITLIFAVLSVGLTYFGAAASGTVGVTSLSTTIASLASLAVFLIPLIALLLSYDSFVGEQEGGTLLLLLTYPLSKNQFFGQGGIITLATLLGFGASALLLYIQHDNFAIIETFAYFILSATLLGLSFTAIAYMISLVASEKSKAAGMALLTWFFFALVFDLALLALLVSADSGLSQSALTQLMMLNPADVFRLVNLAGLDSTDVNGALAVAINANLTQGQLLLILLSWVIAPLAMASVIFKNKKL